MYGCMDVWMYGWMDGCVCVCVCVSVCVCMYVCVSGVRVGGRVGFTSESFRFIPPLNFLLRTLRLAC